MPDLFRILQMGQKAINAHQSAMNTIGHNISNVNTEGYSRQRVNLTPGVSITRLNNIFGAGVDVESVQRVRSRFIDQQLLQERPSFGQFEFLADSLQFIEEIYNEPSDFGLNRALEDFFFSFQDLANDPESSTVRQVVKERAARLTSNFNRIHRQLTSYQKELNGELNTKVDEVNRHIEQIADLNKKIASYERDGNQAPDLRDKRDLMLDKLSKLIDIQTSENQDGLISIATGGQFLLIETKVQPLTLQSSSSVSHAPEVVFESSSKPVHFDKGYVKGLLDTRDKIIPDHLDQLDELARTLASEVNALHRTGFTLSGETNISFFNENITDASDFALSAVILNDPGKIAASAQADAAGDNRIALALSELQNKQTLTNGSATFGDFYNSLISALGAQTQEANAMKGNFSLTVEQLEMRRESISGVSLDEEMVNMIESQNAFSAAARFITTVDEMTQTVLDML